MHLKHDQIQFFQAYNEDNRLQDNENQKNMFDNFNEQFCIFFIGHKQLTEKQVDNMIILELSQDLKEIGEIGHEKHNLVSNHNSNH